MFHEVLVSFAVGVVLTSVAVVVWRFRKTIHEEDYKKKYDDL
jgi:hypothetical protein